MKGALPIIYTVLAIAVTWAEGIDLRTAVAEFNDGVVMGTVKFTQSGTGPVIVAGYIRGISPGEHGFHIHESGNITTGCSAAGAHFNPENKRHGDRLSKERHVGDLGNIIANISQVATIAFEDNLIQLTGKYGILGRAVVIHELRDDGGLGGDEESLKTGNAGKRIACATIKSRFPAGPWPEENAAMRWQSSSIIILSTLITFILARVA